jgi:hypothetical protein
MQHPSSWWKMEEMYSYETSVSTCKTIRCQDSEAHSLKTLSRLCYRTKQLIEALNPAVFLNMEGNGNIIPVLNHVIKYFVVKTCGEVEV